MIEARTGLRGNETEEDDAFNATDFEKMLPALAAELRLAVVAVRIEFAVELSIRGGGSVHWRSCCNRAHVFHHGTGGSARRA